MGDVHLLSQDGLTRAIAERLTEIWDAYVRVDEASHSKYLTEDYRAVHPDGAVHIGRPSAAEMAAQPIEDYWLADLQAWPVGEEGGHCFVHGRGRGAHRNHLRPFPICCRRSVGLPRQPMEVPLLPRHHAEIACKPGV